MSMKRIGIGVIGGGGVAAEGHIRGYQMDPRCEVVALWDVNEAKVRQRMLGSVPTRMMTSCFASGMRAARNSLEGQVIFRVTPPSNSTMGLTAWKS